MEKQYQHEKCKYKVTLLEQTKQEEVETRGVLQIVKTHTQLYTEQFESTLYPVLDFINTFDWSHYTYNFVTFVEETKHYGKYKSEKAMYQIILKEQDGTILANLTITSTHGAKNVILHKLKELQEQKNTK